MKNPIVIRKLILDEQMTFASTWTLLQQMTSHTLAHGVKERDTKKYGQ